VRARKPEALNRIQIFGLSYIRLEEIDFTNIKYVSRRHKYW
jgi:hypothetical protein